MKFSKVNFGRFLGLIWSIEHLLMSTYTRVYTVPIFENKFGIFKNFDTLLVQFSDKAVAYSQKTFDTLVDKKWLVKWNSFQFNRKWKSQIRHIWYKRDCHRCRSRPKEPRFKCNKSWGNDLNFKSKSYIFCINIGFKQFQNCKFWSDSSSCKFWPTKAIF